MTPSRSGPPLQCDHGLRRQAIVQSLLADVIRGQLRAGQHLVTQSLADRFGVSHTPIREALITLAGMGIVDILPNRGAVVRAVTTRDVREISAVRRLLECQAVRSACGRVDREALQALANALNALLARPAEEPLGDVIDEARRIDSALHDLVASSCGNAFLAKEIGRLTVLFRSFRDLSYVRHEARNEGGRLREEAREHLAIVEALLAGNRKEAVRAMSRHLRSGTRYWGRGFPPPATT